MLDRSPVRTTAPEAADGFAVGVHPARSGIVIAASGELDLSTIDDAAPARRVSLLDAVPDMALAVPREEHALARRVVRAPMCSFAVGEPFRPTSPARPFAVVILGGLVLRRTSVGGERTVTELLSAGDLIDLSADDAAWSVPARTTDVVHQATDVAVLDDRFRLAARRWPALHDALLHQMSRQARRASRHLAMLALPRVDDRVETLFHDLADRWGRLTPDGLVVDLPVTHTVLGELVGSRRPTVSLALAQLAASGTLTRRTDGTWLVSSYRRSVAGAA